VANDLNTIISMIIQDLRTNSLGKIIEIIKKSEFDMDFQYHDNWNGGIDFYILAFYLKYSDYTKIADKKDEYEGIIFASLSSFYTDETDIIKGVEIRPKISQYIDWAALSPKENKESILNLINEEKEILIKAGTGIVQIQDVNKQYITKRKYIIGLLKVMCLEPTHNYNDLWDWYNDYKNRELKTYQSRRDFIKSLYEPLFNVIENSEESVMELSTYELTGWEKVDDTALRMKDILLDASITEDYQSVGMFGRELLISLAQAVFDSEKHFSPDGVEIGGSDSKRMLESYINYCMSHKSNPRAIKYAKSAVDFSNELTHNRTANPMDAELCYTAVISTINIIRTLNKYTVE
jgi:hypothetical protein